RPQSKSNLSRPASTSVLGPNRSGRGFGVEVPSRVTLATGAGPWGDLGKGCRRARTQNGQHQDLKRDRMEFPIGNPLILHADSNFFEANSVFADLIQTGSPRNQYARRSAIG